MARRSGVRCCSLAGRVDDPARAGGRRVGDGVGRAGRRAQSSVAEAREAATSLLAGRPADLATVRSALAAADASAARLDATGFAAARATIWTTILLAAFDESVRATRRGDVDCGTIVASRPRVQAADAFLAGGSRRDARSRAARARRDHAGRSGAVVRTDLLDTYDGRTRTALATVGRSRTARLRRVAGGRGRLIARILGDRRACLPRAAWHRSMAGEQRRRSDGSRPLPKRTRASRLRSDRVNDRLEGFRAAPLSADETLRRAGQLDRFLRLVAIEYGRGVSDGKVTKDFEIQEAISFRDGAAAAFADLEPILLERDRVASRRVKAALAQLGASLSLASRGGAVSDAGLGRRVRRFGGR